MRPDLVEAFIREFHAEINRQHAGEDAARKAKEREFAQVTRKLDGLIEAIAGGLRGESLQQKIDDLETRKAALTAELERAAPPPLRLHPNLAAIYRSRVENLHEALKDPEIWKEAIGILRTLVERVVVHPGKKGPEVELIGEIARMVEVALAKGTRKAALDPNAACSVKVVARARKQRESLVMPIRL